MSNFHVLKASDPKPVDHVTISIASHVFKKPLCKFLEVIEVFMVIIENFALSFCVEPDEISEPCSPTE